MTFTKKHAGAAAGLAGAAALACLPCCLSIPLVAPLLAWLGISTLGAAASGWYAGMAGVFVLGAAAFLVLRRRAAARNAASSRCGCAGACRTNPSSTATGELS